MSHSSGLQCVFLPRANSSLTPQVISWPSIVRAIVCIPPHASCVMWYLVGSLGSRNGFKQGRDANFCFGPRPSSPLSPFPNTSTLRTLVGTLLITGCVSRSALAAVDVRFGSGFAFLEGRSGRESPYLRFPDEVEASPLGNRPEARFGGSGGKVSEAKSRRVKSTTGTHQRGTFAWRRPWSALLRHSCQLWKQVPAAPWRLLSSRP